MYTIRYITYLRNRRVFPGRSLGLLSFLALEFGDTVLFGSVVMSFALDEHPCPSTVSQTQKRLVSHHCFFFPLFSREKILTARTGQQAQQPHQVPQQHQAANLNSSTIAYRLR